MSLQRQKEVALTCHAPGMMGISCRRGNPSGVSEVSRCAWMIQAQTEPSEMIVRIRQQVKNASGCIFQAQVLGYIDSNTATIKTK